MKWTFRFVLLALARLSAPSSATELADALRSGNHVLLMRHAYAPGLGDPNGYTLERCDTQRNLDAQGKKQAARIGQWLREQGVNAASLYSSPWCRCRETAELLKLVFVTHHVNIREFMGKDIGSGDMVLAQVDARGRVVQSRVITSS